MHDIEKNKELTFKTVSVNLKEGEGAQSYVMAFDGQNDNKNIQNDNINMQINNFHFCISISVIVSSRRKPSP